MIITTIINWWYIKVLPSFADDYYLDVPQYSFGGSTESSSGMINPPAGWFACLSGELLHCMYMCIYAHSYICLYTYT